MKKNKFYFLELLLGIALSISFVACSSDNPIFDEEEKVDDNTGNNNNNGGNNNSNNIKINVDSIAKIIGLNTFINIDTNDKLVLYDWTIYSSKPSNNYFKATLTLYSQGMTERDINLMVVYVTNGYMLYTESYAIAKIPCWIYKDEDTLIGVVGNNLEGTWKKVN